MDSKGYKAKLMVMRGVNHRLAFPLLLLKLRTTKANFRVHAFQGVNKNVIKKENIKALRTLSRHNMT